MVAESVLQRLALHLASRRGEPNVQRGNPALITGSTPRATGYANPADLIDWMSADPSVSETRCQFSTFDFTWSGEVGGFELPGTTWG